MSTSSNSGHRDAFSGVPSLWNCNEMNILGALYFPRVDVLCDIATLKNITVNNILNGI